MPEGDTIYRSAATLRRALEGRIIRAARGREREIDADRDRSRGVHLDPAALIDRTVTSIEARGKHLLVHLDDRSAVHSHMGMTGSWHVYGADVPWRKPARNATLVLELDSDAVVVCFTPKTLEHLSQTRLRRHPWLQRLGPDILATTLDEDEIIRRLARHGMAAIGAAILDQSIVCGIGNVYKSEVLFLERIDPFARVSTLDEESRRRIVRRCRDLMRRNLEGYPRRTRMGRDGARQWVYGRSGERCMKCGARIRMRRQGDLGRSTYYCPSCQQQESDPS